jgi:hypothetical protein
VVVACGKDQTPIREPGHHYHGAAHRSHSAELSGERLRGEVSILAADRKNQTGRARQLTGITGQRLGILLRSRSFRTRNTKLSIEPTGLNSSWM